MKRLLCPHLPTLGCPVEILPEEAKHATQVLRLNDGATVEALDGQGQAILATLRIRGKRVELEINPDHPTPRTPFAKETLPITLEIALLKGDAMEWVIEKAVELGAQTLVPTITSHSVIKFNRKAPKEFQGRWQKIADQALKQCGRLNRLNIAAPKSLREILSQQKATPQVPRYWCDELHDQNTMNLLDQLNHEEKLEGLHLLIGPEGGWSSEERSLLLHERIRNSSPVSLGPLTLRAETAALFALSIITSYFRRKSHIK